MSSTVARTKRGMDSPTVRVPRTPPLETAFGASQSADAPRSNERKIMHLEHIGIVVENLAAKMPFVGRG